MLTWAEYHKLRLDYTVILRDGTVEKRPPKIKGWVPDASRN